MMLCAQMTHYPLLSTLELYDSDPLIDLDGLLSLVDLFFAGLEQGSFDYSAEIPIGGEVQLVGIALITINQRDRSATRGKRLRGAAVFRVLLRTSHW